MNIYSKWIAIVLPNSILGFILGSGNRESWFLLGMILGVLSWVFLYIFFDSYLIKRGFLQQSRRLTISAILRIPLQLILIVDMYAGLAAIMTVDFFGIDRQGNSIFTAYLTTMFTGLYLSLVCLGIYLLLSAIAEIIKVRKNT